MAERSPARLSRASRGDGLVDERGRSLVRAARDLVGAAGVTALEELAVLARHPGYEVLSNGRAGAPRACQRLIESVVELGGASAARVGQARGDAPL